MGKIKKYIAKIVENGSTDDMEELSDMLDEVLYDIKSKDYDMYEEYEDKLYCLAYGPVLSDEMVDEIIENIGEHWTYNQTENVRTQHGYTDINPLDFYVTMNMAYSDYKDIFGDNVDMYAKFSKAFIDDSDAKEGKVYRYFKTIPKKEI